MIGRFPGGRSVVISKWPVRAALAVSLLALAALSGCYLSYQGTVDVGQTAATLQGFGGTDDESAYYHFEYARNKTDLGAAAGKRTPERGPVAPHTPGNPRAMTFSERVTGLASGHEYWSRVCGRIAGTTPSPCSTARNFFTVPTDAQDHVTGGGTDGSTWSISVGATSGPHGEEPDGILGLVPTKGQAYDSTRATCVRVQGDVATVGTIGDWRSNYYFQDPPVPGHALLTVIRDPTATNGNVAYVNDVGAGANPPDCTRGGPTSPYSPHHLDPGFTLHDVP
jgi:hypothetical protein